jgi:hypothetical protein
MPVTNTFPATWPNPILRVKGAALKDPCGAWQGGRWHCFFSHVIPDAHGAWRFSLASAVWTPAAGWQPIRHLQAGCASPNLSRIGGRWCLTYCTYGETQFETPPDTPNQLFYQTSVDLETWTEPRPLAPELTAGVRSIDPALTEYAPGEVLLIWKSRQTPRAALGRWDVERPVPSAWRNLPDLPLPWFENAQLLQIDERLLLLGTLHFAGEADSHRPAVCPWQPVEGQVVWGEFVPLDIPPEAWNRRERANAGFLIDHRGLDGWFYLISCGRSTGAWHSDGDYALGLLRSADLTTWTLCDGLAASPHLHR